MKEILKKIRFKQWQTKALKPIYIRDYKEDTKSFRKDYPKSNILAGEILLCRKYEIRLSHEALNMLVDYPLETNQLVKYLEVKERAWYRNLCGKKVIFSTGLD